MPTNYRKKVLRIACPVSIVCDGDNADPKVGMCSKCKAALAKRNKTKPPKGLKISGEAKTIGRPCCVCSEPVTNVAPWVISGLPTSYMSCEKHIPEAKTRALNDPRLKVSPA